MKAQMKEKMYSSTGSEWSTSRPSCFAPGKNFDTHLIGAWVGSKTGMDVLEKRKMSCPCREEVYVLNCSVHRAMKTTAGHYGHCWLV